MKLNKKADITWDTVAKMLIALAVLVFILIIIWKSKDKIVSSFNAFKNFLRFR